MQNLYPDKSIYEKWESLYKARTLTLGMVA
jgi:hypothetical protein